MAASFKRLFYTLTGTLPPGRGNSASGAAGDSAVPPAQRCGLPTRSIAFSASSRLCSFPHPHALVDVGASMGLLRRRVNRLSSGNVRALELTGARNRSCSCECMPEPAAPASGLQHPDIGRRADRCQAVRGLCWPHDCTLWRYQTQPPVPVRSGTSLTALPLQGSRLTRSSVMRKCPRCHSSMIPERMDVSEGVDSIWHCLACGKELFRSARRQTEDERLRERIQAIVWAGPALQVTGRG
jgi:ribosomal protein L37AE/L43A